MRNPNRHVNENIRVPWNTEGGLNELRYHKRHVDTRFVITLLRFGNVRLLPIFPSSHYVPFANGQVLHQTYI